MSNKAKNIRQMLLALGTPSYLVDIAIPFMFLMPATTDPNSPSIIEIIRALQRGLRKLGYARVRVTGVFDAETTEAIRSVSGSAWSQKSYVQLAGDILTSKADPARASHLAMAGYFNYEGVPPGPLPSFRAGTPPGPLGMGSTSTDGGVELTFGQGIANKSNIVPIPKTSGTTYSAFKNLQRQINRVLDGTGKRTDEDGIIGDGTLSAANTATQRAVSAGFVVPSLTMLGQQNTYTLAANAIAFAGAFRTYADQKGISASANKGSTATPRAAAEPTPPPMTPKQAASYGSPSDAMKKYLPFLALAAGVAWYAAQKKKGKK